MMENLICCEQVKKMTNLEYNLLEKKWEITGRNNSCMPYTPIISGYHIYVALEDNILSCFSLNGEEEKIGLINKYHNSKYGILFSKNNTIYDANYNVHTLCDVDFATCDNHIYSCCNFLNSQMVIKYDIEKKKAICKSKLFKPEINIKCNDKAIIIFNIDGLTVLSLDLNVIKEIPISNLENIDIYQNLICLASSSKLNQTNLSLFDTKGNSIWTQLLSGNILNVVMGDFIYCSTDSFLYCLDKKGEIIWSKNPTSSLAYFIDKTEHILVVYDKTINIYESETGILVWQSHISHPVCGEPGISNKGIVICTYNDGGIHFFGRSNLWENF